MEEKDKIIISTGHEPEEGLETPHFDAEETLLAARPVVPLTEEAIEVARSTGSSLGTRAEVAAQPLSKRIPVLALVIIAAVSVGLASGLAIGLYQGRQHRTVPAAAQSSSATTTTDKRLQQQLPAPETSNRQLPSVETVADGDKTAEPVVISQTESGQIVVPEEAPETKESPRLPSRSEKQCLTRRQSMKDLLRRPPNRARRRRMTARMTMMAVKSRRLRGVAEQLSETRTMRTLRQGSSAQARN
jgi:hypothetical protein